MTRQSPLSIANAQRGSVALYVLLGMGMLGIGVAELSSLRSHQLDSVGARSQILIRDLVVHRISRAIEVGQVYLDSLKQPDPQNDEFRKCFLNDASQGGASDCTSKGADGKLIEHPLRLFSSTGKPISGSPAQPAYFDAHGEPCTGQGASAKCPYQAVTHFLVVECGDAALPTLASPPRSAPPPNVCPQAYKVVVNYEVGPNQSAEFRAANRRPLIVEPRKGSSSVLTVFMQLPNDYEYIMPYTQPQYDAYIPVLAQTWSAQDAAAQAWMAANPGQVPPPGIGGAPSGSGGSCPAGSSPYKGGCRSIGR